MTPEVIAAMGTAAALIISTLAGIWLQIQNGKVQRAALVVAKETKEVAIEAKEVSTSTHVIVNSQKTEMEKNLEAARQEVRDLVAKEIATAQEASKQQSQTALDAMAAEMKSIRELLERRE